MRLYVFTACDTFKFRRIYINPLYTLVMLNDQMLDFFSGTTISFVFFLFVLEYLATNK